ncbi:MAG: hypothetical protein IJA34_06430 [Lachnospiraceae bacterium]|nr:hypothetical protein [Lachnospiraceae bacterium]
MHKGSLDVNIDTKEMYGITKETAIYMNEIFEGFDKAIEEKPKEYIEVIDNQSMRLKCLTEDVLEAFGE